MADDWTNEEQPVVVGPEVKLFGSWNPEDVQINDISLAVSFLPTFSDVCAITRLILIIAHWNIFC